MFFYETYYYPKLLRNPLDIYRRNFTPSDFIEVLTILSSYRLNVFILDNVPRHEKTNNLVSACSDTNQAVQLQKMARGLKFRI